MARRRFGQHFLHDPGVLHKLVSAISPSENDFIVEIGPGEGALTERLLEKAHVEAIEIDRDLASALAARFPPWRLTVHCADALEFDFGRFPQGLRVVGRTSSFSFRNSDADLKTIGEALGADVILEGSVRTAGDRVR